MKTTPIGMCGADDTPKIFGRIEQQTVTVHVAVMDYSDCSIKMYDIERRDNYDSEDIESWLVSNTNYSDSSCYYMYSEKEISIVRS